LDVPQVGKTTLVSHSHKKPTVDAKGGQTAHVGVAKGAGAALAWNWPSSTTPRKSLIATVQYVESAGVQKERMRESLATLR